MAFSDEVVAQAWTRAGGKCECERTTHDHGTIRCNKILIWDNRGREGGGAWEAHHINRYGLDTLSNCQILCWNCHSLTF